MKVLAVKLYETLCCTGNLKSFFGFANLEIQKHQVKKGYAFPEGQRYTLTSEPRSSTPFDMQFFPRDTQQL